MRSIVGGVLKPISIPAWHWYCTHNQIWWNRQGREPNRTNTEYNKSSWNGQSKKKHGWSKRRETRVLIRHLIMLKTNILYDSLSAMEVVYYSSCTFRSSENICSSSGGALEKGETQWNSFTTKIDGFLSFIPRLNANVLFCRFKKKNLTLCMTKPQGSGAVFFLLYE